MSDIFEKLLNGEVVNGIELYEFGKDFTEKVGSDNVPNYDFKITYNGNEYISHYIFLNENANCSVFGVLFLPFEKQLDVIFGVYGSKVDRVCEFDEMIQILSDSQYINE